MCIFPRATFSLDLNPRLVQQGKYYLISLSYLFVCLRPLQQEQIRPSNGHGVPKCNCNVDAKELTVKKGTDEQDPLL